MGETFKQQIPLVLFTTLLPAGIGIQIGAVLTGLLEKTAITGLLNQLVLSLICTAASAVIVFFHLGHKGRGARALKGVFHSPLSREIILAMIFGGLLLIDIAFLHRIGLTTLLFVIMGLTGLIGLATALSIGQVYNLTGQVSWRGAVHVTGPLLGTMLLAAASTLSLVNARGPQHPVAIVVIFLVLVEILALGKKGKSYLDAAKIRHQLVFPQLSRLIIGLYLGKTSVLLILLSLTFTPQVQLTPYLAAGAMLLDRLAFYASAAQQTPQAILGHLKEERMQAAIRE